MIEVKTFNLPEVVERGVLNAWRDRIRKIEPTAVCPEEVKDFIIAMAEKMSDFGQIRQYTTYVRGSELLLCNMKELGGETINQWDLYPIKVPHMIAVDNYSSMMRIFRRKGKQGLIDYCKAKVKATELDRVLEILNVAVFHIERPEFIETMARIQASKKLEIEL